MDDDRAPTSATASNGTACRRHAVLLAYGREGDSITALGESTAYVRGEALSFNLCRAAAASRTCGDAPQPTAQ